MHLLIGTFPTWMRTLYSYCRMSPIVVWCTLACAYPETHVVLDADICEINLTGFSKIAVDFVGQILYKDREGLISGASTEA